MMKFVVASQYDRTRWDAFVAPHECGHFMQSHAWGVLQQAQGWEPHYCTLEEHGNIRAAALLLSRSVPGLLGKVYYAPRGPVVDIADTTAIHALLDGIRTQVVMPNGIFGRFDPYWERDRCPLQGMTPPLSRRVPRDWSSWNAPRFVLWLALEGSEDDMMGKLSSTCRNEVRRGYKNNVQFTLGDVSDIGEFYRLMTLTGNHKGIAFRDESYYRGLISTLSASAVPQLFMGRFEGQTITTGMSIRYGQKAWLMYAASDPVHYKLRANRTLQWEMIKWAHQAGCSRYDFRGTATSDPPSASDPGLGVYEFKKSFGPEFTRLTGYHDIVLRSSRYRALRYAEDRLLPYAYRLRTWLQRDGGAEGRR